MTKLQEDLNLLLKNLKEQRDELSVQLHLAKKEIQDEYALLEASWEQFTTKVSSIEKEAENAGQDIAEAAKELGNQIKKGYEKIRQQI